MFLLEAILLFTSFSFTAAYPAEDLRSPGNDYLFTEWTGKEFDQLWCSLQGVRV